MLASAVGLLLVACGDTVKDGDSPNGTAGSSSSPPSSYCSGFSACGGNITGRWKVSATCTDTPINDNPACPNYASVQLVSGSATFDFGTDGSLTYAGSITSSFDITAGDECAQAVAHKDAAGYCQ
ncbi:MAG TPA: hypothetical protein VEQ58_11215, partial [Polyangiaceae bacterium]|nr:hypothetical protein [Polyangiaceae bacterium]